MGVTGRSDGVNVLTPSPFPPLTEDRMLMCWVALADTVMYSMRVCTCRESVHRSLFFFVHSYSNGFTTTQIKLYLLVH